MAHYSIFIPGGRGASGDLLKSVGLESLERRQQWDWYDVGRGPNGHSGAIGTVISQREDSNPILGYDPDKQQWTECVARPELGIERGAFWFGIEPERPPRPLDLAHHTIFNGYDVTLKDSNAWRIPETLQMPLDIGRDPDTGELTKMYSPEYADFCRKAEEYVFVLYSNILNLEVIKKAEPGKDPGEISSEFVLEEVWAYCCDALAINYRVCDQVIGRGFLDVLDERKIALIVRATLSMPDILEVIEKKKDNLPCFHPRWLEHVTWRVNPSRPATWLDIYLLEREKLPWARTT